MLGPVQFGALGMIEDDSYPTEDHNETAELAAIHYLIDHEMEFIASNYRMTMPMGIYPRGIDRDLPVISEEYSFRTELMQSMRNAGLSFANGRWEGTAVLPPLYDR